MAFSSKILVNMQDELYIIQNSNELHNSKFNLREKFSPLLMKKKEEKNLAILSKFRLSRNVVIQIRNILLHRHKRQHWNYVTA